MSVVFQAKCALPQFRQTKQQKYSTGRMQETTLRFNKPNRTLCVCVW